MNRTNSLALGMFLLVFLLSLSSASNFYKSWTCADGLNCDETYCGLSKGLWEGNPSKENVYLYFNVPMNGNYSCTISLTESGYGFNTNPQTKEYVDVYLNSDLLGTTSDPKCNSGSSCSSCHQETTSATYQFNLNSGQNYLRLKAYDSHNLVQGSISCVYLASNGNNQTNNTNGGNNQTNNTNSPPILFLYSPQNITYNSLPISLNVGANQNVNIWYYSLNGATNLSFVPNTSLTNVQTGVNHIIVYGINSNGTGSAQVYFTYNLTNTTNGGNGNNQTNNTNGGNNQTNNTGNSSIPIIKIVSPINTTYTILPLALQVNSTQIMNTWIYSLNGNPFLNFIPNTTLSGVQQGLNYLIVYASNSNGTSFDYVYFTYNLTNTTNGGNQTNNTNGGGSGNWPVIMTTNNPKKTNTNSGCGACGGYGDDISIFVTEDFPNQPINLSYENTWIEYNSTNSLYSKLFISLLIFGILVLLVLIIFRLVL